MRKEYTNSSIAWRIELYNSYLARISTKKASSVKLGFRIDNPIWTDFCSFLVNGWFLHFKGRWPIFLESRSHQLRIDWYQDVTPTPQSFETEGFDLPCAA